MNDFSQNRIWSDKIIARIDKKFKHRWEIYDDSVDRISGESKVWVDIGCGDNEHITRFGKNCELAFGIDLIFLPELDNFVNASILELPLPENSVDFISLRYVVEHLEFMEKSFAEMERVLKPGGKILVLTTNRYSPIVALSSLLPFKLKQNLISWIFKVEPEEMMFTYHELNTPKRFKKAFDGIDLIEIQYISDLNYARKSFFLIYLIQHILTIKSMRSNILAVFEKTRSN